jgi:stress response protein SCP2
MSIFSEFGQVDVVRNRWVNAETAFLVKKENISRRVMQPLVVEALAKTGDADKVQIVCEEGLQVKGQNHMAFFKQLTSYTGSA